MGFIATGDFQGEWNNLDLCSQAWDEVLTIAKKEHLHTIVFLGDGKQAYNPIDGRVVKWWQSAIGKALRQSIQVLYVEGNHDRFGRYKGAGSWLSILKKAGATVFKHPSVFEYDGMRLFILPYSSNADACVAAKELLKHKPNKDKDILLFHHELSGAKFNQQGSKSDAGLSLQDIGSEHYRYCLSGHVHLPQEIENVYYAGSPFCMDWGEVNQRKRYLVVRKNKVSSVDSKIPRWYDPDVAGFKDSRPRSTDRGWRGTKVRVSVKCDASTDYGRTLEKARKRAEHKYKGATIYTVPKFKDRTSSVGIKTTDSDDRKIKEYVRRTYRGRSRDQYKTIDYMLAVLGPYASGLRGSDSVTFISASGKNFLPFKKVSIDFKQPGINVIQGINYDRAHKSNGSGKTSLVQLPPVSLFGKTFKDQAHDRWSNSRILHEPATAEVVLKDYKGSKIKIIRGRRPPLLQMSIDGKPESTGMKSTDRDGTQLQIEQKTGFTWQTLANSVYIDRTISDAFLSGTKKQRTEVLSRFQNLERFDKALQQVKKDRKEDTEALEVLDVKIGRLKGSIQTDRRSLKNIKELSRIQIVGAYNEYKKWKRKYKKWTKKNKHKIKILKSSEHKLERRMQQYLKDSTKAQNADIEAEGKYKQLRDEYEEWLDIKDKDECPVCFQHVNKHWVRTRTKSLKKRIKKVKRIAVKISDIYTDIQYKGGLIDADYTEIQMRLGKLEDEERAIKIAMKHTHEQYIGISSDSHSAKQLVQKTKDYIVRDKLRLVRNKKIYRNLKSKILMYEYVIEAFSREGIPAFLNRELCPILNKAADYYAEKFSDREIQLRFMVDEGEFVPVIINSKGGDGINDQSTGERALAGLIASFALREVAPKSNLLILDEPGDGLDEQTARQFARALQDMKSRLGSIWITTHNVHILSELSGENIVTVKKEHGISRISNSM